MILAYKSETESIGIIIISIASNVNQLWMVRKLEMYSLRDFEIQSFKCNEILSPGKRFSPCSSPTILSYTKPRFAFHVAALRTWLAEIFINSSCHCISIVYILCIAREFGAKL